MVGLLSLMELIWIVIIILTLIGLLSPLFLYRYLKNREIPKETIGLFMPFALSKIGERDFESTRGYQHLLSLENIDQKISLEIKKMNKLISDSESQVAMIDRNQDSQLFREYSDLMVVNLKDEISGIGANLASNIRSICYRGNLEDLRRAQFSVRGIGEQRQHQIDMWINDKLDQYPSFLQNSPLFVKSIKSKFQSQKQSFYDNISSANETIKSLKKQVNTVKNEIRELSEILKSDFQLAQTNKKTIMPYKLLNGIHPPWEEAPIWYIELHHLYGG
jgi:hypothetical protein